MSVARRVCSERGWQMPHYCGYQIGLDRTHVNEDTRITYVTTGVLLQKMIVANSDELFLNAYTHIILDEVHERDLETDFVLLVTKIKSFKNLQAKVILMSATIEINLFREYFGEESKRVPIRVPVNQQQQPVNMLAPKITVKAQMYHVHEFYWEDLVTSKSFLSPLLQRVYRERVENYKRASDLHRQVREGRNDGYNYRSFRFDQRILDTNMLMTSERDEVRALEEVKKKMENIEFNIDEPAMTDQAMLMVITLLK